MAVSIAIVIMGVLATVWGQPADMSQLPPLPETSLKAFNLPPPPELKGPLTPNYVLAKAFKFAKGVVSGPESLASDGSYIYTGVKNSRVFEFGLNRNGAVTSVKSWPLINNSSCTAPNTRLRDEEICGRPLGIRAVRNGVFTDLIVLDASRGIFRIRFPTDRRRPRGMFDRLARYRRGVVEQIMDARNVNQQGITIRFLNDLVIAKSGFIFFTSSSDKYSRTDFMKIILEGDKTGRVLVYNPHAKPTERVSVLAKNLHFPNGIQLSPDETFLLVAEGARARIHKIWLATEKRGQIEIFADNLPGFIDNIRPTPRGTYWVAVSSMRSHAKPGVLDMYGPQPKVRQLIVSLPKEQVMARSPKYGMIVELNADGQIIRSLHDPDGTVYGPVSEVMEYEGFLLLGSYKAPFIGTLQLSQLPPAMDPPPTLPGSGSSKDTTDNSNGHNNNGINRSSDNNNNNNNNNGNDNNTNGSDSNGSTSHSNGDNNSSGNNNNYSENNNNNNKDNNTNTSNNDNGNSKTSYNNNNSKVTNKSNINSSNNSNLNNNAIKKFRNALAIHLTNHIERQTKNLTEHRLRGLVLKVLQRLVDTAAHTRRIQQRAQRLQTHLQALKQMLPLTSKGTLGGAAGLGISSTFPSVSGGLEGVVKEWVAPGYVTPKASSSDGVVSRKALGIVGSGSGHGAHS